MICENRVNEHAQNTEIEKESEREQQQIVSDNLLLL